MRVYIDGLFYKGSGIGRYYASITKELVLRGVEIYTAVPANLKDDFLAEFYSYSGINPFFVDYQKFSPKGFLMQSFLISKIQKKVDIFFWPHINLPLYVPENTVVTVHDLIPLSFYWDRSEIKRKVYLFMLVRAIKKAKKVVCISKSVCNELEKFSNTSKCKLELIYEPIDIKFKAYNIKDERLIKDPYILFVGNRKPHKNLTNLLKAFHIIKTKVNHKLVIAGKKDNLTDEVDKLVRELDLKDYVIEYLSPSDDVLLNLYRNANLFVFPSFYEGFGLPPLEAISLGCPVILSDIPVFREIFDDSALYFDPHNPEDIAQKILLTLENREMRCRMLMVQREKIKLFDNNKSVEEHIRVFSEVING